MDIPNYCHWILNSNEIWLLFWVGGRLTQHCFWSFEELQVELFAQLALALQELHQGPIINSLPRKELLERKRD